ncbi:hypothetical protein OQI89_15250 [Lentilactobacillus diolivorans]|jgi:hypothetical protein|uniref:exodeoxyribonuclease X C-terminal domain-containing protein n=1 Tax=Lentilactobacillus diolivorans TaxID=179838 RepID=UPI002468C589|nr:hypothetical protein [Lentilactobacillus diolivorans]MDH5107185.1 hypothetical protein [Lentilactobacillus diolivorans]
MTEAVANKETGEVLPANSSISLIENLQTDQLTQELTKINQFQEVVKSQLVKNQDFGVIPGTQKPTLLKPGAEKILMILGVQSRYTIVDKVENYEPQSGYFDYTVKATLIHDGTLLTEGLGNCNTREKRYHRKGKNGQPDLNAPFDNKNTVLKMAKKRAQIDATLTIASLSNIFTQDIEDMADFNHREQTETMNDGDAASTKLTFGKYKGKTLGEALKENRGYVEWLLKNARDESVKKAAEMVLNPSKSKPKAQPKPTSATDKKPDSKPQTKPNASTPKLASASDTNEIGKAAQEIAQATNKDPQDVANAALKKIIPNWTGSNDDWNNLQAGQAAKANADLMKQIAALPSDAEQDSLFGDEPAQ